MMDDKPNVALHLAENSFYAKAKVGEHSVAMDEPLEYGGTDLAPSPVDMVQVALAGCIAMTLKIYAERKGWDLGEIWVDISIQKNESNQDVFFKSIRFGNENALDEKQKIKLQRISGSCPVSKMLSSTMVIKNADLTAP